MRISGFHIDGFGVFHDVGIEVMDKSLTVILGDNGAGKSTLLEFFRAALFGFRGRRTSGPPGYKPLRGGQHGGHLTVRMSDGTSYRIIRSASDKVAGAVSIVGLDNASPARELSTLLGGASRDIFENVFAFSLGELQDVATLDREELRDRLYAAGSGAGARGAPGVRAALEKGAAALYKKQGGSKLHLLLTQLEAAERRRQDLSGEAERYAQLTQEYDRIRAEIAQLERRERDAESSLAQIRRLLDAWPDWLELQEQERLLAEIGDVRALPEQAEKRYAEAKRTEEERTRQLTDATARAEDSQKEVDAACAALGDMWTAARVATFDTGEAPRSKAAECDRKLEETRNASALAAGSVQHARDAANQTTQAREALEAEQSTNWPKPPRILADVENDLATIHRARAESASLSEERGRRSEMEGRKAAAESDVRRLTEAKESIAAPARLPLVVTFGLLVAASILWQLNLTASAIAFGLFLAAFYFAVRQHRQARSIVRAERAERIREAEGRVKDLEDKIAAADEHIGRRQAELNTIGAQFGIPIVSSVSDLDPANTRLQAEAEAARAYTDLNNRLRDARKAEATAADALEAAERGLNEATLNHETELGEWKRWITPLSLRDDLTPQAFLQLLTRIASVQALLHQLDGRRREVLNAQQGLQKASAEVMDILREAGDADETAFKAHLATVARLNEVRTRIQSYGDKLVVRAGGAERWSAMRDELASTTQEALDVALQAGSASVTEVRRLRTEAQTRLGERTNEMKRLETGDELEAVTSEIESLRAQASDVYDEWIAHRLGAWLIEMAQASFERNRQPEIIRRAGAALAQITGGAYSRLIRRLDSGDLEAESDGGALKKRPAWNRGLLEQIYLSMRLGFIEDYCRTSEPLPVIMDDVFANFDPDHAERAIQTLVDFAEEYQTIYLTCHPDIAQRFRAQAGASASYYTLSDYRLEVGLP